MAYSENARRVIDPANTRTRGVYAGAYRGKDLDDRALRTHAVDLTTMEALCRKGLNVVDDDYAYTEEEQQSVPTCPVCAEKDPRFQGASADDFMSVLEGALNVGDRQVTIRFDKGLGPTGAIFVNLVNLPAGIGSAGGGAEAQNNRIGFTVGRFPKVSSEPVEQVKVEQLSSALPREYKLRSKSGAPRAIAKYLAEFINRVVAEVPPKFTHTKMEPNGRLALDDGTPDPQNTAALRRSRLTAKNHGDIQSAVYSAAYYAKKTGKTMFAYLGNSYGHAVWRVSYKPGDYLSPINNQGTTVISVAPDLSVFTHKVSRATEREDDELEPNGGGDMEPNSARGEFLTVWSRSRFSEWVVERTYPRKYVRDVLGIPAEGAIGDDSRFYFALPQGEDPPVELLHPKASLSQNGGHYVWVVNERDEPLSEGPFGPYDRRVATTVARIQATEGAHNRAVSRGLDPQAVGFAVIRKYEAGSGNRLI